jgi:hypothetical protein
MNVQVIADPRGRLPWASPALPGAVHDIKAARTHGIIDALTAAGVRVGRTRDTRERTVRSPCPTAAGGALSRRENALSTAPTPRSGPSANKPTPSSKPGASCANYAAPPPASPTSSRRSLSFTSPRHTEVGKGSISGSTLRSCRSRPGARSSSVSEIRAYEATHMGVMFAFIYLYPYYTMLGIVSNASSGLNAHWSAAALGEEYGRFHAAVAASEAAEAAASTVPDAEM